MRRNASDRTGTHPYETPISIHHPIPPEDGKETINKRTTMEEMRKKPAPPSNLNNNKKCRKTDSTTSGGITEFVVVEHPHNVVSHVRVGSTTTCVARSVREERREQRGINVVVVGEIVAVLRPNDVLLGRGTFAVQYPGNVRFRTMIHRRKEEYMSSSRHSMKQAIANEIYQQIQSSHGRFLSKVELPIESTGTEASQLGIVGKDDKNKMTWIMVDESVALEKIKQALREPSSSSAFTPEGGVAKSPPPQRGKEDNDTGAKAARTIPPTTTNATRATTSTRNLSVQPPPSTLVNMASIASLMNASNMPAPLFRDDVLSSSSSSLLLNPTMLGRMMHGVGGGSTSSSVFPRPEPTTTTNMAIARLVLVLEQQQRQQNQQTAIAREQQLVQLLAQQLPLQQHATNLLINHHHQQQPRPRHPLQQHANHALLQQQQGIVNRQHLPQQLYNNELFLRQQLLQMGEHVGSNDRVCGDASVVAMVAPVVVAATVAASSANAASEGDGDNSCGSNADYKSPSANQKSRRDKDGGA